MRPHGQKNINSIFQAIHTRDVVELDDKDVLLGVDSCPKLKFQWMRWAGRKERVKLLLTTECCTAAPAAQSPQSDYNKRLDQSRR